MAGKTPRRVWAVYLGQYRDNKYHETPPIIMPEIVKETVSHIWRRRIAKISLGVIAAEGAIGLGINGPAILFAICCPCSVIVINY
jgi:hypothetical protein